MGIREWFECQRRFNNTLNPNTLSLNTLNPKTQTLVPKPKIFPYLNPKIRRTKAELQGLRFNATNQPKPRVLGFLGFRASGL